MAVVVQHSGEGAVALADGIFGGQRAGMLVDQIVQAIAAAGRFGEQVMVVEGLQVAARGG